MSQDSHRQISPEFSGQPISAGFPVGFPTWASGVKQASMAALTNKQILAVWHSTASTRDIALRRCYVNIVSNTVASIFDFEVFRITTAPTGGSSITPVALNSALTIDTGVSSMSLPSGAGTESGIAMGVATINQGIITAPTVPSQDNRILIIDAWADTGSDFPRAKNATLEGFALKVTSSASTTLVVTASMEFFFI